MGDRRKPALRVQFDGDGGRCRLNRAGHSDTMAGSRYLGNVGYIDLE